MSGRGLVGTVALLFLLLASGVSCGLFVSFDDVDVSSDGQSTPTLYAVGVVVDGLRGAKLTVVLNGAPMIVGDGRFDYPRSLADGAAYTLARESDPPGLTCTVEGGTGTIASADVTVPIHCASSDATLVSLSLSAGLLATPFDAAKEMYTVHLPALSPLQSTTVTATVRDAGAKIAIAGIAATSGAASGPILLPHLPAPIDIVVTAADAKTQKRYTVVVTDVPDYLKASTFATNAQFGSSIALSGDTLAVGAITEASNATGVNGNPADASLPGAGAVYVFIRTGGTWSQQAYIKASNTRRTGQFGASVALDGDTLAVGSPGETSSATGVNGSQANASFGNAGAVYVFTRTGAVWSQQAYVKASNTRAASVFGISVALSADTLAVGSSGETSSATGVNGSEADGAVVGAGAAYVFTRTAGVWKQQAYVKASNTRASAFFGSSVALSGDTLAVGSHGEASDAAGVNGVPTAATLPYSGAVYVFARTGITWVQQAHVKASLPRSMAHFGTSVALAGDTLAVGAVGESSDATGVNGNQADVSKPFSGAVYVFVRAGLSWSQQAYVKASNTSATAQFGDSVALTDDVLAVGASRESSDPVGADAGAASYSGAAYLFTRTGSAWSQQAFVKASNPRNGALFGRSVAFTGRTLAVGSPGETSKATGVNGDQTDTSAVQAGAAYVFP